MRDLIRHEPYLAWGSLFGGLAGLIVFAGSWIYCVAAYGFLLGVSLGWIPASILGMLTFLIVMFLWAPLILLGGFAWYKADEADKAFRARLAYDAAVTREWNGCVYPGHFDTRSIIRGPNSTRSTGSAQEGDAVVLPDGREIHFINDCWRDLPARYNQSDPPPCKGGTAECKPWERDWDGTN